MARWSSACSFNNYTLKISQPSPGCVENNVEACVNLRFPSSSSTSTRFLVRGIEFRGFSYKPILYKTTKFVSCTTSGTEAELEDSSPFADVDCVGTGLDVECLVSTPPPSPSDQTQTQIESGDQTQQTLSIVPLGELWEWAVLVSPFFFWGTAMVAMKEVLPKAGPFFVSAFRLIPAGFLLVAFAASRGRPFPSGLIAWVSIALFGLVDAACFQGFLAQGLERTSAGLGSVSWHNFGNCGFSNSVGYMGVMTFEETFCHK